ncbi:hypothetical protein HGRIS_006610 [Hohenbuehelia grisea]|uniref:SET domain-containing protein n=1 Tax=Hohenbuehelia grisea TaxID=104357 RepID=A0ABR3JB12_9AGAR
MKRGFLQHPQASNGSSSSTVSKKATYGPHTALVSESYANREMFKKAEMIDNQPAIRSSYGVLDNASRLPKDHDIGEFKYEVLNGATDHSDNMLVMTRIPNTSMNATPADVPGGWSECLVTGSAKRSILRTPGFPHALPSPALPVAYRVAPTPNKGLGVFATRAIRLGELIVSERPLIISPAGMDLATDCPDDFTDEQVKQASLAQREKMMEVLVHTRMHPERREAYLALCNSHLHDGSGPLMGIMRTNGFGVDIEADKGIWGTYSGVFDHLSRVNHSCSPNTIRTWRDESLSMQLFATRDIAKDEEITCEYCDLLEPASARQKVLAPYDVVCTCNACRFPGVSDLRRKEIKDFKPPALSEIFPWAMNPALPDDHLLKPLLRCAELIRQEGLEAAEQKDVSILLPMLMCYVVLGDEAKAKALQEKINLNDISENRKVKDDDPTSLKALKKGPLWALRKRMHARR